MVRFLKLAGWASILGGFAIAAARMVMLLQQQAFAQVASGGVPALVGLGIGVVLLVVAHLLAEAPWRAIPLSVVGRAASSSTRPIGGVTLAGLLIMLVGLLWAALGLYVTLPENSSSFYLVLALMPGGGVMALGLIIAIIGACLPSRRRQRTGAPR